MPFLHPALLWLLPLAAVPAVLHLLTLQRVKTVELSTFRFLFDSYIQQRRRMQFLEALLAVLRTLFILLLVLMIAGPIFSMNAGLFGAADHDVILLVDCSASMNARSGGLSAFDRARSAARLIAGKVPGQDRLTLVAVAARPKVVFSGLASDQEASADRGGKEYASAAEAAIDGLKTTSSRGDVFAALMDLFGPDAVKRPNPLVFFLTDCQSTGWREVRDQGPAGLVPDETPFVVVNVGAGDDLSNAAVLGDAPRRGRAVAGLPYLLQPRAVNFSKKETAEVTLSVFIEDKEVSRSALTLKPGETAVRRIPYTPRDPGVLRGRFEIAGASPDRFPDDDRFLFTLNVSPRIKAVVVDGQPPGQPIQDADEAHYLKTALTSGVHAPAAESKPAADDFLRPFDVQVVPEASLTPPAAGQLPEALKDARLAVLANCGGLEGPQFDALRTFVAGGGGLLIFPGDRVNPQVYDDQFFPVPGPQGERLTAARLEAPEGDPGKTETFERLGKIDFGHPALALFDNPDPDARPLSSFRVYKRFKIAMPEQKGNAWPLAWFSNGAPALVESRLGDGDVILSAFPAHTRWTSLPTRPDFTPLVLQLADHVARRPPVDAPSVVLADGRADFTVNGLWGDVKAGVKKPSGGDPVGVDFERNGPRLLASFADTSERGYYTLDVRGNGLRQGEAGTAAFAVNLSPEESDFTSLTEGQLRELLPWARLAYVEAGPNSRPDAADTGNELEKLETLVTDRKAGLGRGWWFALLLAVIASEFFLATWGGRRKKAEDDAGAERVPQGRAGSRLGGLAAAGRRA